MRPSLEELVDGGPTLTIEPPKKKQKRPSLDELVASAGDRPSLDDLVAEQPEPAPTVEDKLAALPLPANERAQHIVRLHRNRMAQAQAANAAEGDQPAGGFGEALATGAADAAHDVPGLLKSMVTAPIRSVATFGRAARETGEDLGVRLRRGDPSTVKHTVSPEQAGLAGAQIMSGLAAGPLSAIPFVGPYLAGGLVMSSYGAEHARTPGELGAQAALGMAMGGAGHAVHAGAARGVDHLTDFTPGAMEAGARGVGRAMDFQEGAGPFADRGGRGAEQMASLSERGRADRKLGDLQSAFSPPPAEPPFSRKAWDQPAGADWWSANLPDEPAAERPSEPPPDTYQNRLNDARRYLEQNKPSDFSQYLDSFKKRVDESLNYSDEKFGPGEQAAAKPADTPAAPDPFLDLTTEPSYLRQESDAAEADRLSHSMEGKTGRPKPVAKRYLDLPVSDLWTELANEHFRMGEAQSIVGGWGGTMPIRQSRARLDAIQKELLRHGYDPEDIAAAADERLGMQGRTGKAFASDFDFGPEDEQTSTHGETPGEGRGVAGVAGSGAPFGAGQAASDLGARGEPRAGNLAPQSGQAPGDTGARLPELGEPPERVDLFGNAVEPTAEQASLFGSGVGAGRAETPGAISPEEMTARRDELGAPRNDLDELGGATFFANPIAPVTRAGAKGVLKFGRWAGDQSAVKNTISAWNRVLDPAALTPEASGTASAMRTRLGEMAGTYERRATAMTSKRPGIKGWIADKLLGPGTLFDQVPDGERLDFIDRMEEGKSQATPDLTSLAKEIRTTLDTTRDEIRALGSGALDDFIENYFPHIWADPKQAQSVFAQAFGQRPLEGSKAFLKQRSIPTVKEGVAQGLKPLTTNPVELSLLKLREMQRFLMAQRVLADLKTRGLVEFVPGGMRAPAGFTRLHDKIARVPGKGEYWAQDGAAQIVNNYLSPGLRGNALYDPVRWSGNALNQAQLGLSGFHLGFTSVDAMTSRVALGLEQFAHGKPLTAVKTIMSMPAAPITNFRTGARVKAAYLKPGTRGADADIIAQWVERAGGRVKMDSFYRNSAPEKLVDALRQGRAAWGQRDLKAIGIQSGRFALNTIPGVLQTVAKPIMEWIVPAQKLGVFADLAREAMDELGPTATREAQDAALQKVWNSVDNRMGQLVYDNLFWNKAFKDLSMAATRSVGWNLGTIRELGGGVGDAVRETTKYAAGEQAELTHRAAYIAALPITVGMIGAVVNYLATGEAPQSLRDYFFPRTGTTDDDGNWDRVQLPSYLKDVVGFEDAPWQTVKHKMGPQLALIGQMLDNQDYYGDQIRNVDDPIVQQAQQEAAYVWHAVQPFSFQNAKEAGKRGDNSVLAKYGPQMGLTPAPRRMVRSDAQNIMADYLSQRRVTGATPEDAQARMARRDVLAKLRGGSEDLADAIDQAVERGQLTPPQFARLLKRAGTTPMRERYQRLTVDQAVKVFEAADERERALFLDLLEKKLGAAARQENQGAIP